MCHRYSYNLGPAHVIHLSNYSPSCNSKSKTSLSCLLPINRCASPDQALSGITGQAALGGFTVHLCGWEFKSAKVARHVAASTHAQLIWADMSFSWYCSAQYKWLKADLAKVNRAITPWLFVSFHEVRPCSLSRQLRAAHQPA